MIGNSPVTLRPRSGDENGVETQLIQTSDTGEIATNVKIPGTNIPGTWKRICSSSNISIKVMNMKCGLLLWEKKTVNTQSLPDVDQVIYTQQFALGSSIQVSKWIYLDNRSKSRS